MTIVAYAFLYALALIQLGAYGQHLPNLVASHFVAGGAANGYMARESFIIFYLGFIFFLPGVVFAASALIRRTPGAINLPNRDYWMAPQRRAKAVAVLATGLRVLGLMMGLFLIGVQQLIINANLQTPAHLDENGMYLFLGLFAFCLIAFSGWMIVRFRIPGKDK